MINTTIFKTAFIFLVVVSTAISHPVKIKEEPSNVLSSKPTTEESPVAAGDHYDQRQNGTKNFRLHVDGVVLVVAPAEALLLAGELDPALLNLGLRQNIGDASKPGAAKTEPRKPTLAEEGQKPIKQKSGHSHGLQLSNLLGPILRHISP